MLTISLSDSIDYGCPYCSYCYTRSGFCTLSVREIQCFSCGKKYCVVPVGCEGNLQIDAHPYKLLEGSRKITAFYSGSFDPVTLGHVNIISRVSPLFSKLIVGVGVHPTKNPLFTQEDRVYLIKQSIKQLNNVQVIVHKEDPWEAAKLNQASILVRGLRNETDFVHEYKVAAFHRTFGVDTMFLMATDEICGISSTSVRELITAKKWDELVKHVPASIIDLIRKMSSA